MAYTPRFEIPAMNDPRWTMVGAGGYNTQVAGNPQVWPGSVIANCTGYVHGRWMEIGGKTSEYNLSVGNATTYYGNTTDGYERGTKPKLGAVACWEGGLPPYYPGHVAIVEQINDDGSIIISQSNYGGIAFNVETIRPETNFTNWPSLRFQGFIYHPDIQPEPPKPDKHKKMSWLYYIAPTIYKK